MTATKRENSAPSGGETMQRNGIEEFKEVMADFRSLTSLAVKGAIAVPFADLFLRQFDSGISPPWPSGILIITSLAELLSLVFAFNFFFQATKRKLNHLMIASLVVLCLSFVGYLYLHSSFTHQHPKTKQSMVLGYQPLNEDIRQALRSDYTTAQILEENEYSPTKIWTEESITQIRIGIFLIWLISFASFSFFIALFVISQRRAVH